MAPQTSYTIDIPAVAFPGQKVDMSKTDALTGIASAASLPYGILAVRDTTTSFQKILAKVPALASDITTLGSALGVVMADQARAQDPSVAAAEYPRYSAVPLMKRGRIWVVVEEAVVAGDQAFVRFATGAGGSQKGAFRKSADTATAAALANAYYQSAAALGEYAVLELDLPA